jgi:hypothetical protein
MSRASPCYTATPRRPSVHGARDQVTQGLREQFEPLRPTTLINEIHDAICKALRN